MVVIASTRHAQITEEVVKYSYFAKKQIMTNAEKVFYDKLLATVGEEYYVVPQAHLSMFIDHKVKGQNWKAAFSTINGKSVDFLIVEKTTQRPALAIELDDYTHQYQERIKRDAAVKGILEKAQIPLQRYAANSLEPDFGILLNKPDNT